MYQKFLTCAWCVVATWTFAGAEDHVETLEQLRHQYQRSSEIMAQNKRPVLGSEGFHEKMTLWTEANTNKKEAGQALIPALLNYWVSLSDESADLPAVGKEIKAVCQDLGGSSHAGSYAQVKSFLARTSWPLLVRDNLTPGQAIFLSELIEPHEAVRLNDAMARRAQPTEASGWDVQAAYALALIRCGNDVQARGEIEILHTKVALCHKVNPKGGLDYGPEAGKYRYRNYVDYLQLCEILSSLRAAIANDHVGAVEHLKQARGLRDVLSPEADLLIVEVSRRAAAGKE